LLFGGAKIGASETLMEGSMEGTWKEQFFALAPIFPRSKSEKCFDCCGKPDGNACYAGYGRKEEAILSLNYSNIIQD